MIRFSQFVSRECEYYSLFTPPGGRTQQVDGPADVFGWEFILGKVCQLDKQCQLRKAAVFRRPGGTLRPRAQTLQGDSVKSSAPWTTSRPEMLESDALSSPCGEMATSLDKLRGTCVSDGLTGPPRRHARQLYHARSLRSTSGPSSHGAHPLFVPIVKIEQNLPYIAAMAGMASDDVSLGDRRRDMLLQHVDQLLHQSQVGRRAH